jgi:hypothetical protein
MRSYSKSVPSDPFGSERRFEPRRSVEGKEDSMGWSRTVRALSLLIGLFAANGYANEALHSGAVEVRTRATVGYESLTANDQDAGTKTEADASLFAGVFLTRWMEIGVGAIYNYLKIDPEERASTDRSSFGIVPEFVVNLAPSAEVVPYLGAGGGVFFYSGDYAGDESATIIPRLEAGLRFFVVDGASVNVSGVYAHWTNVEGDDSIDADRFTIGIGISVYR